MHFTNNNYYQDIDSLSGDSFYSSDESAYDQNGKLIEPDDALNFTAREIGTTTNPMGNTLESLKARIREGASRVEFSFMGAGKGTSQSSNPELYGKKERRDMRELLEINKMNASTHAAVHMDSLAGFTKEGFNNQAKDSTLKEIKKAIDFAADATKGGAIVFHFSEWQRPLSGVNGGEFMLYDEENEEAPLYAVDSRTGKVISGINKQETVYRPKYKTASAMGLSGQKDNNGEVFEDNDWVDVNGNRISRYEKSPERLFDRVPEFNKDKMNFEVDQLKWDDLVKETKDYNDKTGGDLEPEELYARIQLENAILQQKGSSLFHARAYSNDKENYDGLVDNFKRYKKFKDQLPEDKKYEANILLKTFLGSGSSGMSQEEVEKRYIEKMEFAKNTLKHIHESSSSADVKAMEFADKLKQIKSVKKEGLSRTADTVAKAALYAMDVYNKKKGDGLEEPLYVAPENWDPRLFGSHPAEYREAIDASRKKMVDFLKQKKYSDAEADKLSKTHIKGTLDIGHLNLYRSYYKGKPEDFNKWMLGEVKKLVDGGYVGHIHLSDNFGYDDQHLTPGQGNVPMKEFLKLVQDAGLDDIIVEPGSYNVTSAMLDTMSLTKSPVYGVSRRARFNDVQHGHFGYNAPGFFIAGSYVPSNEWKLWSDVPLE